jgi:hypothetical protein
VIYYDENRMMAMAMASAVRRCSQRGVAASCDSQIARQSGLRVEFDGNVAHDPILPVRAPGSARATDGGAVEQISRNILDSNYSMGNMLKFLKLVRPPMLPK